MKKVISLSAIILLGYAAFAQDSTSKSNPHPNNSLDTMPKSTSHPKDTSTKHWNSPKHNDSTGTNTGANTMNSGTGSNNTMPSDSMNTNGNNAANGNNGTMSSDSSSMSHNNNHNNMDSMSKTSGSQNNSSNSTTTTTTNNTATITADSIKAYEKTLSDRVMMKDDKMYMLKDGEATPLEKSYKLSSGAIVSTTGTVKYPGGKVITLKNGQFIEIKPATATQTEKTKKSTKAVITKKKVKTQS